MAALTEIAVRGVLTAALRAQIASDLARSTGPVLLTLSSTGLSPDETGQATATAEVAALCQAVAAREGSVAVLTGTVRGAALELALAASLRVAEAGARLSFPDIALGLVPGAGATQRLPRLVGGAGALRLLLDGTVLTAVQGLTLGLIDQVVESDARSATLALGPVPERRGLRDGRGYLAAVAQVRAGAVGAAARMVDCVEMALMLPLEQGLAYERVCHEDLCASEDAAALRHIAGCLASASGTGEAVARIGIWGGGKAAVDLVFSALAAGLTVQLAAERRDAVVQALADVAERQEALVQAGTLAPDRRDADWARLLPQVGADGLTGVDLAVLTEAGDIGRPSLSLGFAAGAGSVALYRLDRMAELQPQGADAALLARCLGFVRRMGWEPVVTGSGGPVGVRLATALADAVEWAEAQGFRRDGIAQSLAGAGIAGEGGGTSGPADAVALRCLAALANAGARAILAGEAPSACHVDAVAVAAGLMARWTGGPMHQANRRGLLVLRRDLREWETQDADLWSPAPLFDALIAEGRGFS